MDVGRGPAVGSLPNMRVALEVVLFVQNGPLPAHEQQGQPVIQHTYLVRGHELPAQLLLVLGEVRKAPLGVPEGVGADSLLAQELREVLMGIALVAAQVQQQVGVIHHGLPLLFVEGFELAHVLQDYGGRNAVLAEGGKAQLKVFGERHVGKLDVHQHHQKSYYHESESPGNDLCSFQVPLEPYRSKKLSYS